MPENASCQKTYTYCSKIIKVQYRATHFRTILKKVIQKILTEECIFHKHMPENICILVLKFSYGIHEK